MLNMILNFIASLCIFVGGGAFYIMLFSNIGRGKKVVDKFPAAGHWLIKFGLALTATGAFLNMVTLSSPAITEVIMNIGLGALFIWASIYHGKKFGVITKSSEN